MIRFIYIFREMLSPFFLTALVLSSVLMMEKTFYILPFFVSTGLDYIPFFKMLIYSTPTVFAATIPISVTMAVFTGMYRLTSDSEVVSLRAAGISLTDFFKPVLFFALIMTFLVGLMTIYLSPRGIVELRDLKFQMLKQQTKIKIKSGHLNKFGDKLLYIAKEKKVS